MKIQWNKVTWCSKVVAGVLGIAILVFGIYIGIIYQRGVDAIELAEQLKIQRPSIVQKKTVGVYGFTQEGNIKNMAMGDAEEDEWVLVYEVPGDPALIKPLIFTTQSECVFDRYVTFCDTSKLEQGQRVTVMGSEDGSGVVTIERLEAGY